MLGTLRLASRVAVSLRPGAFALGQRLSALPQTQLPLVTLHPFRYSSDRPSKSKTNICSSDRSSEGKKPVNGGKQKTEGNDPKLNRECCSSKTADQDRGPRTKTVVCDDSKKEFLAETDKDKDDTERFSSDSSSSGSSSDSSSSDEEMPKKECSDSDELTDSSEEEGKPISKPASEMCDCVKAAVAQAKNMAVKSLDSPRAGSTRELSSKQNVSEHVQCCNVETAGSKPKQAGSDQCNSVEKEDKKLKKEKETSKGEKEKGSDQYISLESEVEKPKKEKETSKSKKEKGSGQCKTVKNEEKRLGKDKETPKGEKEKASDQFRSLKKEDKKPKGEKESPKGEKEQGDVEKETSESHRKYCECIKKALDTCKSNKEPTPKPVKPTNYNKTQKPGKPTKPDTPTKANKPTKTDKPSPKVCNKKKPPVVKCN